MQRLPQVMAGGSKEARTLGARTLGDIDLLAQPSRQRLLFVAAAQRLGQQAVLLQPEGEIHVQIDQRCRPHEQVRRIALPKHAARQAEDGGNRKAQQRAPVRRE